MRYMYIALIVTALYISGCPSMGGMGGLEIDDGKGNVVKWSVPDEKCMQFAVVTTANGVKMKRTQRAVECVINKGEKDAGS